MCISDPSPHRSISVTGITRHAIVGIAIYAAVNVVDLVLIVVAINTCKYTKIARHIVTGRARIPN